MVCLYVFEINQAYIFYKFNYHRCTQYLFCCYSELVTCMTDQCGKCITLQLSSLLTKLEQCCMLLCLDECNFVLVAIFRGLKSEFTQFVTKCIGCEGFKVVPMFCDVMLVQILINRRKLFSYSVYNNYCNFILLVVCIVMCVLVWQSTKYFNHCNQVVFSESLS